MGDERVGDESGSDERVSGWVMRGDVRVYKKGC